MTDRLVSVHEAAAYCGVKPPTFRKWIKRAGLNFKIKGTHKYDISAIARWIDKLSGIDQKPISAKDTLLGELEKERPNATIPRRHKRNPKEAQ